MSKVGGPRFCVVCGREFLPNISKSLFICDDLQCITQYEGLMEEIDDAQWDSLREPIYQGEDNEPRQERQD